MLDREGKKEMDAYEIDKTCLSVSVSSYFGTGANISSPHPSASMFIPGALERQVYL